ncbi:hypothetical protein AB4Z21_00895 [Paenibacillus sp. MCAF20]
MRQPVKYDPYFKSKPAIRIKSFGKVIGEVFIPPAEYLNDGLVKRKEQHHDRRPTHTKGKRLLR